MIKIGITGSIASGKTTASKILSSKKSPLFSADAVVKSLYKKKSFINSISKKFQIKGKNNFKKILKKKILTNNKILDYLEKIIHPLVRSEMKKFTKKNQHKNILLYEIPLLIESKLTKFFDKIIFIKSKKINRLRRYQLIGGDSPLFNMLDNKQMPVSQKVKFCKHIVTNDKDLNILKKNLMDIIKLYE